MASRSVAYHFAHRALPTLFFADPKRFFDRMERDGRLLLGLVWDKCAHAGGAPGVPAELDVRLLRHADARVALVTMPTPSWDGEAFFAAAWQGEQTRLFTRTLGRPRYFTLERQDQGEAAAALGEWNVEGHRLHGPADGVKHEDLLGAIERRIGEEQARALR